MRKKDNDLQVIEETSKIIEDMEKGFNEILANHTMKVCMAYEEELAKYKRAFEILKKNIVPNQDIESLMDIMVWREDNEEEYELLEELMKSE